MTGTQFGQFLLGLVVVAVVVAIVVWLLNWLYLRSSKERAFVRTGFGGQKVVMNGGAFVLPIVHDVLPVNMNTLRLEVSRGRDKALITKDRMRVDVTAEFYVRVQATVDAIASAAQTLGQRTLQPGLVGLDRQVRTHPVRGDRHPAHSFGLRLLDRRHADHAALAKARDDLGVVDDIADRSNPVRRIRRIGRRARYDSVINVQRVKRDEEAHS